MHLCLSVCLSVSVSVPVSVPLLVCLCLSVFVCVPLCLWLCICVCIPRSVSPVYYDYISVSVCLCLSLFLYLCVQGRRPRGTGGTVLPKFEVGGRLMHWSPQYFEKQASVVGFARKYEQSKKGVFLVTKG